jgi:CheY-like chemotaxis protein
MFGSGIETGLRALGFRPVFAQTTPAFDRLLKGFPALVLVNVGSLTLDWAHMVDHAKNESQWREVPIVAYGPHVDLELRQRALEAGCDGFVARSAVASDLPSLVRKWAWVPDLSACQETPPAGLLRGVEQFNRREFFECHETIELVWMAEPGPIRLLYQGILQVGVALYHVQRKNWRGAVKVLERAIPKLAYFEPACAGLDISRLLADAHSVRQHLIRLGAERIGEFDPALVPVIRLATDDE